LETSCQRWEQAGGGNADRAEADAYPFDGGSKANNNPARLGASMW